MVGLKIWDLRGKMVERNLYINIYWLMEQFLVFFQMVTDFNVSLTELSKFLVVRNELLMMKVE